MAVLPFIAAAIVALAERGHRPASLGVLGGATLAAGPAFFWWTNPFGGWTGLSLLMLIPIQGACCMFALVARWLWRATPLGP